MSSQTKLKEVAKRKEVVVEEEDTMKDSYLRRLQFYFDSLSCCGEGSSTADSGLYEDELLRLLDSSGPGREERFVSLIAKIARESH